jgi:hypothetical protein
MSLNSDSVRRVTRRTFLVGLAAAPILANAAPRRMKMSLACGAIGVKATQLEVIDFALWL